MIEQYELKYQKLNKELLETQKLLHAETESKKQFESDLKRVFLKNLTHMNMEAYALFNGGCSDPTATIPGGLGASSGGSSGLGGGNYSNVKQASELQFEEVYQQTSIKGLTPTISAPAPAPAIVSAPTTSILNTHTHGSGHVTFASNSNNIIPKSNSHTINTIVNNSSNVISHHRNNTIVNKVLKKSTIMTIHKTNNTIPTDNKPVANSIKSNDVDLRGSIENQIPRPYIVPTPVHYSSSSSSYK